MSLPSLQELFSGSFHLRRRSYYKFKTVSRPIIVLKRQSNASSSNNNLQLKTLQPKMKRLKEYSGKRSATSRSSSTSSVQSDGELPISKKAKNDTCVVPSCNNAAYSRSGKCRGHARQCVIPGCDKIIKSKGRCWHHGGRLVCRVQGCKKGAKTGGLCTAHGGGKRCSEANCDRSALKGGICWAHGGGKRCAVMECRKPASGGDYCLNHKSS